MQLAIADGHAVSIHYRLTLEDGSTADDSTGGEPLEYIHGTQSILPGLERGLVGKHAGDECEVVLEPEEGYGSHDPALDHSVARSKFPAGVDLQPGMTFQAERPQGPVQVWVSEVRAEEVVVSTNHPLAGKRLKFSVQVVGVRQATPEEQAPPET